MHLKAMERKRKEARGFKRAHRDAENDQDPGAAAKVPTIRQPDEEKDSSDDDKLVEPNDGVGVETKGKQQPGDEQPPGGRKEAIKLPNSLKWIEVDR